MRKFAYLILALTGLATQSALAQQSAAQDIKAKTPRSGYVQNSSGVIVRNPYGLCWHTGYWTKDDAVEGCDLPVKKEETKATPAPAPTPTPTPPAPPVPTSEKVTFAADAFFDFDKSNLKPEGKAKLDDLAAKLQSGVTLEVVVAVGHTDSIGTVAYNQKLSLRRAESVKSYLISKGVDPKRIYTEGKGKSQPIADNKTAAGRAKNRRVEIEVVGTRPTSQQQ